MKLNLTSDTKIGNSKFLAADYHINLMNLLNQKLNSTSLILIEKNKKN